MRKIGYSDKVFQYKETRNLRIQVLLQQEIQLNIFRDALAQALGDFPEYAVTPVKKDKQFYYMENNKEIGLFPDDGTERYLGTEETNGYLFCILYAQERFVVSFFHGLTDFKGMYTFILHILYYYAKGLGMDVEDIRQAQPDTDMADLYDPYGKYADASAQEWKYTDDAEILTIPGERIDSALHRQHEYLLHISTKKFIDLTHKWKTSFIPALTAIASDTIAELYDAGEKTVVLKVPADLRPFFNSQTRVNFSDALVLASSQELREKPMEEQCRLLREMMDAQLNAENFKKLMAAGVSKVRQLSGEEEKEKATISMPPLTYAMTYPGRMNLPQGYASLVKDFRLKAYVPVDSIRLTVKTTGNDMTISIAQAFDRDDIVNAICRKFQSLGFEPVVEDLGRFGGDRYSTDKICEIKE